MKHIIIDYSYLDRGVVKHDGMELIKLDSFTNQEIPIAFIAKNSLWLADFAEDTIDYRWYNDKLWVNCKIINGRFPEMVDTVKKTFRFPPLPERVDFTENSPTRLLAHPALGLKHVVTHTFNILEARQKIQDKLNKIILIDDLPYIQTDEPYYEVILRDKEAYASGSTNQIHCYSYPPNGKSLNAYSILELDQAIERVQAHEKANNQASTDAKIEGPTYEVFIADAVQHYQGKIPAEDVVQRMKMKKLLDNNPLKSEQNGSAWAW